MVANLFSHIFRRQESKPKSRIDRLTYAIGDIHGRDDLFERMIDAVKQDASTFKEVPRIVLLGDYVDRGPASSAVIERILTLEAEDWCVLEVLIGNHELSLLNFLENVPAGVEWVRHGGGATLLSYGVTAPLLMADRESWEVAQKEFAAALPKAHRDLLGQMKMVLNFGDYLFVHAGVNPNLPLSEQGAREFLWIRKEFLAAQKSCDYVVVHGHTPMAEPVDNPWRISVDTGGYATGILTAVRLNSDTRKFLQVS